MDTRKNYVVNTTEEIKHMGIAALFMGTAAGIESSELAGQAQLVQSDVLPADMGNSRATLEAWGIKILDPVQGDEMFVNVELPAGWSKRRTDHSMWSDLVDDRGQKRAAIFYKAAFYDRSAFISTRRRLTYGRSWQSDVEMYCYVETSDGVCLYATEVVAYGVDYNAGKPYWDRKDAVEKELFAKCTAWLSERYPEWESETAYWDIDFGAGIEKPQIRKRGANV